MNESYPPQRLGRGLTFAMATAAGIAVANIYYNQPLLGIIERDLPGQPAGLVPTATQLGYAAGLFLLVPLGDLHERKRLIVLQFLVLAGALVAAALAPNAWMLIGASLLVGAAATVAQQIVPFAAHLADPARRGQTVGMVMAGLLCGILLSRTLSGFVGTHAGWREMFWLGVPLALGTAAVMAWRLPRSEPESGLGYGALLRSLAHLWVAFAPLRLAATTQALLFAGFTAFWTILALYLQSPQFRLGADVAGLFGVVGAAGILGAPLSGRIADRSGPHRVVLAGALLAVISWAIFGLWASIAALAIGVILLDFAVQSALVSNQHIVFALQPEARARLNTVLMGSMFLGGAGGSATATLAWGAGGWTGVALLGGGFSAMAALLQLGNRRRG